MVKDAAVSWCEALLAKSVADAGTAAPLTCTTVRGPGIDPLMSPLVVSVEAISCELALLARNFALAGTAAPFTLATVGEG